MVALRARIRRVVPLAGFIALFSLGLALLAGAEVGRARLRERERKHQSTEYDWRVFSLPVLEHLGSALVVAAVMGVSYEYIVHRHVIKDFEKLLQHHEDATDTRLAALEATTAHEVFSFVGRVATRLEKIPTLYEPARSETNEIVFVTDKQFFASITGSTKARADTMKLLDGWLDSAKLNLRFLASDFVGLLQLCDLAPRLRDLAAEWEKDWDGLDPDERGCVLNFWWAASRCETPMYETLLRRLVTTNDQFTRQWILFVPRQMPDARWAEIIDTYLRYHYKRKEQKLIEVDSVIAAIKRLHASNVVVKPVVFRNRKLFEALQCWDTACRAIEYEAPERSQSRFMRFMKKRWTTMARWRKRHDA